MKKSEKIIAAICTMVFGVMLCILKNNFIGILMTVAGVSLIVLGIADIVNRLVPPAVIKIVAGAFIIFCGWVVVEAVLYILAAAALIFGVLLLYDKIKHKICCSTPLLTALEYAIPALCIVIGILLLFHRGAAANLILILCGLLTVCAGGIFLFGALTEE